MKALVAYYTRTGITKKAAEAIAEELKADIDEIIDEKDRKGSKGYLLAGRDATLKKLTKIRIRKNPSDYDLVIIGTPVWAFTMATAVRTYLMKNKFKKTAYFATQQGSGAERALKHMEEIAGKPKNTLILFEKEIKEPTFSRKVKEFCRKIKRI